MDYLWKDIFKFMQIAIYNRVFEPDHISVYEQFFSTIKDRNVDLLVYKPLYPNIAALIDQDFKVSIFDQQEGLHESTDFFISFGGDGTTLDAILYVQDKNIPILGINLGRLGFLADVRKDDIEFAANCLFNRNYTIEARALLRVDSNIPLFSEFPYALNDFTILKKDTSSMIKVSTYLNGQYLNTYWCDGLICATPTGSTGYSLSCGGPVVFPQTDAFVITPISPHNLNVRPIIIPNDYVVSFEVEGRAERFLCTLDSRQESIDKTVQLAVRKADFGVRLVRVGSHNFLDTIKDKMYWGVDTRN